MSAFWAFPVVQKAVVREVITSFCPPAFNSAVSGRHSDGSVLGPSLRVPVPLLAVPLCTSPVVSSPTMYQSRC